MTMELFLVPNDPERMVLVSSNGVAHYQVRTSKIKHGPWVSVIQRPAETEEDSIVAEVEWRYWKAPTIVQCPLLSGMAGRMGKRGFGVPAKTFLYKRCRTSSYVDFYPITNAPDDQSCTFSARYFVGNDGIEYRWKYFRDIGAVVSFLIVPPHGSSEYKDPINKADTLRHWSRGRPILV
jgi:hypothetical protein